MSAEFLTEVLDAIETQLKGGEAISDEIEEAVDKLADEDAGWALILEAISATRDGDRLEAIMFVEDASIVWRTNPDNDEYRRAVYDFIRSMERRR